MKEARRVEGITESVIREMTRKAKRYDAINLSQGYPDYPTHEDILEGAKDAIDAKMNQYSITWGKEKLRKKIAEKLKHFNEVEYDPEFEVTVTCGSSESIMSTMLGLIEKGDEVLIFQPFYENYVPSVRMASGEHKFTTITRDQEIDREEIKEKVSEDTKAMIVNTPHNPTGKVFDSKDLEFIRDICIDNDVLAVTDEMYERMIYEGNHISLASLEGMWERTVSIGGFSKVYSITGWRVGYSAAPKELMKPIRKAHDYTTVCAGRSRGGGERDDALRRGTRDLRRVVRPTLGRESRQRRSWTDSNPGTRGDRPALPTPALPGRPPLGPCFDGHS